MLPRFDQANGVPLGVRLCDSCNWEAWVFADTFDRTATVFLKPFLAFELFFSESVFLAQDAPASPFGGFGILPFILIVGAAFYFMVVMPGNKERAEKERVRNEIKKNDRIITIGGIHGTVVNAPAEGDEITIKLDENSPTRMRITRSAIQTVVTNKESGKKDA